MVRSRDLRDSMRLDSVTVSSFHAYMSYSIISATGVVQQVPVEHNLPVAQNGDQLDADAQVGAAPAPPFPPPNRTSSSKFRRRLN
jgi:hypothetical protein